MTEPVKFSQDLADHICRRLVLGESLKAICDEQGMPAAATVQYWRHTNPDFAAQYDDARESQAESIFEEILDIADDGSNDWMEKELQSGRIIEVPNHEHITRSRLRIDARWKVLARMNPKRYSERSELDLKSSDGSMSPALMTEEQRAAKLTALHQKALALTRGTIDDGSDLV